VNNEGQTHFSAMLLAPNLLRNHSNYHREIGMKKAEAQDRSSAGHASLRYVTDDTPGIRRQAIKSGFRYVGPDGKAIRDKAVLARIRTLAIPPAYADVWICPLAHGHLQATGRDARGRKQYRYHARWREVRDAEKYGSIVEFGRVLPTIRKGVARHLRLKGLPREKVLAAIVSLLEQTLIRVGNEEYARDNGSFGLTTLRDRHAAVSGAAIHFRFKGKSGVKTDATLHDKKLAAVVKCCQDLPGQELFQYVGDDGEPRGVDSSDVNEYLKELTGGDFTAKDFRTWNATLYAAAELGARLVFQSMAEAKKNVTEAVGRVAERLNNTPTVCRNCYIHPRVIESYLNGHLPEVGQAPDRATRGLTGVEVAVLSFLRKAR